MSSRASANRTPVNKAAKAPISNAAPQPPAGYTEEERLRWAREQAKTYRTGSAESPLEPSKRAPEGAENLEGGQEEELPQTLDEWQDLVSRRVEEAIRQGMFDNLPGKGKPQPVKRDPFVSEDQQMAFSLMKKNQITPGWIGDRKSILAAIEALRGEIREFADVFAGRIAELQAQQLQTEQQKTAAAFEQAAAQWHSCVAVWEERVQILNGQILNLNLTQPFHYLEIYKLRLDEELKRAGAGRTLPPQVPN